MRTRRPWIVLLVIASLGLTAWEVWRGTMAFFLLRGKFALLERWGGDEYFLPALRRTFAPGKMEARCPDDLAAWATRRYQARFPEESVYDLAELPTGELLLLLGKPPLLQSQTRLVVLDLDHSDELIAASNPADDNAHGLEIQYFPGWEGPAILVRSWGTGESGTLFRYWRRTFSLLGCRGPREDTPRFSCWTGLRLIDIDGDGIPEVQGSEGKWAKCPWCGRESQANWVTWKLVGDSYFKWTVRSEECGLDCEFAWSMGWSY